MNVPASAPPPAPSMRAGARPDHRRGDHARLPDLDLRAGGHREDAASSTRAPATRRAPRWRPASPRWRARRTASPSPPALPPPPACSRSSPGRPRRGRRRPLRRDLPPVREGRGGRMGVTSRYVDARDPAAFEPHLTGADAPGLARDADQPAAAPRDIAAVAAIARAAGVPLVVDNTFATPCLPAAARARRRPRRAQHDQVPGRPLRRRRRRGGHVSDDDCTSACSSTRTPPAACPGPFDAWLTLRGIKTLAVRMRRHCAERPAVASTWTRHPRVERRLYPGPAEHPQHELAARQMRGFGGMVSFALPGGREQARRLRPGGSSSSPSPRAWAASSRSSATRRP